MRLLRYSLILLLTFFPLAIAALLWLCLSGTPLVTDSSQLSHQDLARIKTLIKLNDPRRFQADTEQRVRINEADLNLIMKYALTRFGQGAARIKVHERTLDVLASLQPPRLGSRLYLNIQLQLTETGGGPDITRLRIGRLRLPDILTQPLLTLALRQMRQDEELSMLLQAFHHAAFEPGWVHLRFTWDPRMLDQARGRLMSEVDREAMADYYAYLLELQAQGIGTRGSLLPVLAPLFERAQMRSERGDPVRENRALLAMLGAWASGSGLEGLLAEREVTHQPFRMTLRGRLDLAQHLLVSAALTVAGNAEISSAVGLYKEMADITQGSGFSFTDIAADRAGVRFGDRATATADSARELQNRMNEGLREADIMPLMQGLPEGLRSAEFKRRYGDADSPAFKALLVEIDRRIAACRLYAETNRGSSD